MQRKKVAIIGAGPSGMAQMRAFEAAEKQGEAIPDFVCFEKQSDWGGQWNYTWRTGVDEFGEPVHSSMYRNLWSNGPKEGLEFSDYTFDEHFGRPISSYPPRTVLWDYIAGRLSKTNLRDHVRFETIVRHVSWDDDTQLFTVHSEHLPTGDTKAETFDNVIVASGHFSFPNMPEIEGVETFPGVLSHAHDFRGAEGFDGLDVLVIGSSYSAEDIGTQCFKMGAKSVTASYRTQAMGYEWPKGFEERPLVQRFDGSIAHFADGSTKRFDVVIFCTGYVHKYPYLPTELALSGPNTVYPAGLYRGVVWDKNPNLFYVGAQDQWFTFNMFDAQAWFVRDVILGRRELPTASERAQSITDWTTRFEAIGGDVESIEFQGSYVRDLIDASDYPDFNVEDAAEIFISWKGHKAKNIMGYRDLTYRSVITGTHAAKHHTAWMDELDDSVERYLATDVEAAREARSA
ncbi:NAD(P)/FAD-dependent oxidoreductase [Leucobacter sp. cx-328]|uniref:NAD(P)-binding domain-containing protein n=1 Tax=unclassified Leucobacter TaxID=2621730 RepID=UPI00165DA1D5|nr:MULTISPECIES: NAD(P)/FAD-dependent oxidoreductase [unclassified Leucobacter]MBC9943233.1 NAD(P)/FAD-dependent oxidoreductase [Leucobacter sp. cx-328]